jgi:hypothetical protein
VPQAIAFFVFYYLGASVAVAAAIGTAVFSTVIGIGVSYALGSIARALHKGPSQPDLGHDAVARTVNVRQAIAPRRIIYGYLGRIGGVITYANLAHTNNEWLDLIITIAGHECESIGPTMNFDDQTFTIDPAFLGGGIAHDVIGKFHGVCFVEINPGTANPAEFGILRADSPALWTVNHRQRGCAGVHLRLIWSADKYPNGTPNATFDVKGRKVYDPRTGLTAWSDNPALCTRDFLSNTDFGLGAPDSEIDDALVIAAANICDELISLAAGGTEKRYTANGSFQTSEEPESFSSSCSARWRATWCTSAASGACTRARGARPRSLRSPMPTSATTFRPPRRCRGASYSTASRAPSSPQATNGSRQIFPRSLAQSMCRRQRLRHPTAAKR